MSITDTSAGWPGWETVKIIGAGSYGTVYEIQRNLFSKTERAALKRISVPKDSSEIDDLVSEGYDSDSLTAHFKDCLADIVREYAMMQEIRGHRNVVYCEDIQTIPHADGIGWDIMIKMELLTPLLKGLDKTYDESQVVKLGMDLCSALQICREKKILHRDIKPQNIFISASGDYKLGDFGVAKVSERTTGGTKIGTYGYMAPEIYNNLPYGTASDLYSLGLVLYWMMNERRGPFLPLPPQIPTVSGKDSANRRRFSGEPLPDPAHGSEALKAIVRKACAFEIADRYHSPEQMREALGALLSQPEAPPVPKRSEVPAASDLWTQLSVTLEEAATGCQKELSVIRQELTGDGQVRQVERKVLVGVPAGIGSNQQLGLRDQGNLGGTLYVKVTVQPHRQFVRQGADVYSMVALSAATLRYGGPIRLATINGNVDFAVPAGTSAGMQYVIPNAGMPILGRPGKRGNHYFTVVEKA